MGGTGAGLEQVLTLGGDTDAILLRIPNILPVVEWGGEFGGRFAMTQKYNNAFLAIRRMSPLSGALLDLACKWPRGKNYGGCVEY